jgi:cell division protein FtsW
MIAALTAAMLLLGLTMILSASSIDAFERYGSFFSFFNRQILGTIIGLAAMVVLARIDYRKLRPLVRPALLVTVVLLVAVLMPGVGTTRGGSSRWLLFGPFALQPSEMAKIVLVAYAAHVLDRRKRPPRSLREMAPLLVPTSLVCFLILLQPDLGTTLVAAAAVLVVLFLSGASLRHVGLISAAGVGATVLLMVTEGYRRARLFGFLDPWGDPLNAGYQSIQGQIALGSGGWFGLGLGASRQKWSYVPNAHTDFIYAILGEELGLVGTFTVLLLFVGFVYFGVRIARKAPDRFGSLLAGGIVAWITIQALVNMGAVTGLLPITGVPLPFISYGGSSLVFTMAGVGILMSIARRGRA